jgi:hypothetical protein
MKTIKLLAALCVGVISANADIIYTTMSPTFQPASGGGSPHGGAWVFLWDQDVSYFSEPNPASDFKGYRYFAGFTTPSGTGFTLSSISLSLARSLSDSNSENLKVSIYQAVGNLPNLASGPVETFTGFSVPTIPAYTVTDLPASLLTLSSSLNPILAPSTTYFISLEPEFENTSSTSNDATYFWYYGDVNRSGIKAVDYFYVSNSGWSNMTPSITANEMNGITVTGTPIPEAASFALCAGFVALTAVTIKKRKRG